MIEDLRRKTPQMLDVLSTLVEAESPSSNRDAIGACASLLAGIGEELLGTSPERLTNDGNVHLRWSFPGEPSVLLLGHFDTVWPIGTTARWPFEVKGDEATGPGIFDMKAGLVQGLFAIAQLDDREGIHVIFNSDEEVGSNSSRGFIEEAARKTKATLVLEPSEKGALKIARKGVETHHLSVKGRAAHAGLDPESGINALIDLAYQVLTIPEFSLPEEGTTVAPTFAVAGTSVNTIPAEAEVHIDVRALSRKELNRVREEISRLKSRVPGTALSLRTYHSRPPLPPEASRALFELALEVGKEVGLANLEGAAVGGGSDGNLTADVGAPTLDGLGAVGSGAHAEGERVRIVAMPERSALVARLIEEIKVRPAVEHRRRI